MIQTKLQRDQCCMPDCARIVRLGILRRLLLGQGLTALSRAEIGLREKGVPIVRVNNCKRQSWRILTLAVCTHFRSSENRGRA